MREARARAALAPEHAGDFRNAGLARERRHLARGLAADAALGNDEMMVAAGRDLRQVRDGEHLHVAAEALHQAADGIGHGAANAGIDLVEDQRAQCGRCGARRRRGRGEIG